MASDHDSGVDSYYDTPRQRPVPKPRKSVNSKKTAPPMSTSAGYTLLHIAPETATCDGHENILMVFNRSLPSHVTFIVSFTGVQSGRKTRAAAKKIGENVLLLEAPTHYPAEETKLTVHVGEQEKQICSHVKPFRFRSHLQLMMERLHLVNDPVEFMCAALHLKQKDTISLDFELERVFKKKIPKNFDILKGDDKYRLETVSSPDVNPTLLHFAARYNLLRLALALLDCHGGHRALNVANSEELTPSQIAHELGHEKLAEILAEAQQNPNYLKENDPDDIYISMGGIYEEYYLKIVGSGKEEDIYEPMGGGGEIYEHISSMNEEEELYMPMNFSCEEEDYVKMGSYSNERSPIQETANPLNEVFESLEKKDKSGSFTQSEGRAENLYSKWPASSAESSDRQVSLPDVGGLLPNPRDVQRNSFVDFLQTQTDVGSISKELADKIECAYVQLHTIKATDPHKRISMAPQVPSRQRNEPIQYADIGKAANSAIKRTASVSSNQSTTSSSSSSSSSSSHSTGDAGFALNPYVSVKHNTGPLSDNAMTGPALPDVDYRKPLPPVPGHEKERSSSVRTKAASPQPLSPRQSQTLPRNVSSQGASLPPVLPPRGQPRHLEERAPMPLPDEEQRPPPPPHRLSGKNR